MPEPRRMELEEIARRAEAAARRVDAGGVRAVTLISTDDIAALSAAVLITGAADRLRLIARGEGS